MRVKDYMATRHWENSLVDKDAVPRMPWRDINVKIEGEVAKDMGRNFIQYWSFIKNDFASQKEARVIGVSQKKEQKRNTSKNSNMTDPCSAKKLLQKACLTPVQTPRNILYDDNSLDEVSILSKEHKNVTKNIEEVKNEKDEDKKDVSECMQKSRVCKSVQSNVRAAMWDLIQQIKEDKHDENDIDEEFQEYSICYIEHRYCQSIKHSGRHWG